MDNVIVLLLHVSMLHVSIESPGEWVSGTRFGGHQVCTVGASWHLQVDRLVLQNTSSVKAALRVLADPSLR